MNHAIQAAVREDRYRPVLANQARGGTLRSIYQGVYGSDYPGPEVEPFGFVTVTELQRMADVLAASRARRLVDIGCGRGGPGLWIAARLGARLVGVDIVAEAVVEARSRANLFDLAEPPEFRAASAIDTGLPNASFDAALSVDALWMVIDKARAFREIARILQPGGIFVFTTWEPRHLDHFSLLRTAGFGDIHRIPVDGWYERQTAVYAQTIARRAELKAELGAEAADVLITEARLAPTMLDGSPRVIIHARRS